MYYYGKGVKKDYSKTIELFTKACDKKTSEGYNAGYVYYRGEGVRKNIFKAKLLFSKACAGGMEEGCQAHLFAR